MEEQARVRVLFLDDDRGVAEGVAIALAAAGVDVVAQATTFDAAVAAVTSVRPDVVVADIDIAGELTLELPAALGPDGPPVLWWSGHADAYRMPAAGRGGAAGYVGKREGIARLIAAIRNVARGGTEWTQVDLRVARSAPKPPTSRELEVLAGVAAGRASKQIAADLGVTERTVESHLRRMYDRYACAGRIELLKTARQYGWIART